MALARRSHAGRVAITGETLWKLRKRVVQLAEMETPLGPLTCSADLPQGEGRAPMGVQYISPLAFLWQACRLSLALFKILQGFSQRGGEAQPIHQARIALYLDDVMPGNVHRPDAGRSYVAIYWTFLDLPDWLLHSTDGWFVLSFVPKKIWKLIPGEQSGLMRIFLTAFWPDDGPSFGTGFLVQHGEESLVLQADGVDAWLLDGDAVSKVTLSKTMSAFKCCCKCRNVVARISADKVPAGTLVGEGRGGR